LDQDTTLYDPRNRQNLQAIAQIEPLHYKLTYEQFYVNYVFDDTSQALVNMYFQKRVNTRWGFLGMSAALLGVSLVGSKEETVCITTPALGSCLAEKKG